MSYKSSSKKDEADYKEYAKAAESTTTTKKPTLQSKLDALGVDINTFALGTEEYRKRVLKGDYDELKDWTYGTYCKDGEHWDTVTKQCITNE